MIINEFDDNEIVRVIAGDTETHTYIDNVLMSTEQINAFFREKDEDGNLLHDIAFARKHVRVNAYAWLVSNGKKFAWLENFTEFVEFCCQHKVKTIWWYNAKFDFSFFDYEMLTNDWQLKDFKELTHKSYHSLHGEQGQRYKLTLCYEYARKGVDDRHKREHIFSNYDFCNLFGGGLANNLKAFNVVDYDGNPIRKLEMDYQAEIDDNAIQYMKNDVHGLFHLVRIASEFLEKNTGYSLMDDRPLIITAGGLAKRELLETMYNTGDYKKNVKIFKKEHRMSVELDEELRNKKLYQGGKTIANSDYLNKLITKKIFYYDRNSMYPSEMAIMPDLIGGILVLNKKYLDFYKKHNYEIIYEIENYHFSLKDGALAVLYNPFIKQYCDTLNCGEYNNRTFLIYAFELEMLSNFYNIKLDYKQIYAIERHKTDKYKRYVEKWYNLKAQAKKEKNGVLQAFSKLMLNSSYGKLAQNPVRINSHREINEDTGAVHLIEDDSTIDENSMLSIIIGSYITAKARCSLMSFMIELCGSATNTREHIFYCDTDSVQTDIEYSKADAFKLGGWKLEEDHYFDFAKYLAPKTYALIMKKEDNKFFYLLHSKGVQTKVLSALIDENTPIEEFDKIFKSGKTFQTLSGLNVVGGKALLPLEKMLCREDNISIVNENSLVDEREI